MNKVHPELGHNEIFLSNINIKGYNRSSYKSKRLGLLAYDINGDLIGNSIKTEFSLYPMFVGRSEYEQWMNECDNRHKLMDNPIKES